MGEPTCLMQVQQPFSYVSGLPNEANEGNPIHGLGQSISFGRFMSESLAWEKWSTFSHNRYVEEAERYSRPGSVAQKKAFFEAHYKNLAARKAAALLEQQQQQDNTASASFSDQSSDQNSTAQDSGTSVSNSQVAVDEQGLTVESKFVDHTNDAKMDGSEQPVSAENVEKIEVLNQKEVKENVEKIEFLNQKEVKEADLNEKTVKMEKSISKRDQEKKKITVSSSSSSSKSSTTKSAVSTKSSAKSLAPNTSPLSKKPPLESAEKKRSTPKSSLHNKAVNFTPIREINRLKSTVIRKIENSRFGTNSSSKANKDYCSSTPLRTPITVSKNGTRQQPLETPCSASKRATTTTPVNPSASGGKPTGPRWRLLATDCSKFLSACRNKTRSPFSYTPFSLRTEERAAKRKEKLEEKFNANEALKDRLKTKVKDKPETETGKLRQGFCFKARPLPDFYKQRKAAQNDDIKKVPLIHPQPPKLGNKFTPSKVESRNPQTPKRPPVKNNGFTKQVQGKTARSPTYSLISRTTRTTTITHENRSPNIQHG